MPDLIPPPPPLRHTSYFRAFHELLHLAGVRVSPRTLTPAPNPLFVTWLAPAPLGFGPPSWYGYEKDWLAGITLDRLLLQLTDPEYLEQQLALEREGRRQNRAYRTEQENQQQPLLTTHELLRRTASSTPSTSSSNPLLEVILERTAETELHIFLQASGIDPLAQSVVASAPGGQPVNPPSLIPTPALTPARVRDLIRSVPLFETPDPPRESKPTNTLLAAVAAAAKSPMRDLASERADP